MTRQPVLPGSFYRQAASAKPRIMTADQGAECARLLAEGKRPSQVAHLAGVKESTVLTLAVIPATYGLLMQRRLAN